MKINFDQEITREDGSSIVGEKKSFKVVANEDGDYVAEPTVTYSDKTILADVCKGALVSGLIKVDVSETMKRFHIHNKIKDGGEVELSEEELAVLKDLVNNKYDLLMAGKLLIMLGEK